MALNSVENQKVRAYLTDMHKELVRLIVSEKALRALATFAAKQLKLPEDDVIAVCKELRLIEDLKLPGKTARRTDNKEDRRAHQLSRLKNLGVDVEAMDTLPTSKNAKILAVHSTGNYSYRQVAELCNASFDEVKKICREGKVAALTQKAQRLSRKDVDLAKLDFSRCDSCISAASGLDRNRVNYMRHTTYKAFPNSYTGKLTPCGPGCEKLSPRQRRLGAANLNWRKCNLCLLEDAAALGIFMSHSKEVSNHKESLRKYYPDIGIPAKGEKYLVGPCCSTCTNALLKAKVKQPAQA